MSDKETSAENLSVETKVAADEEAVKEETKKRAILGSTSSDANGDANERDDPAAASAANHVVDDDDIEKEFSDEVEKGSMENCDDAKEHNDGEEEQVGLPGDDANDMKGSPPSQSSPPPSKKSSSAVEQPNQSQTNPGPRPDEVDVSKQIYHVKWIGWHDTRCPIIMQNVNGPCPLLSITNVLLLRGKMSLDEGTEVVSSESLIANIADLLLNSVPSSIPPSDRLDYEQNINDAINLLPRLQTGLDVNVKFSGVSAFEYTNTCVIFDQLNISLYHGWLTDPQELYVADAIGTLSYNQLVEKIITDKTSDDNEKVSRSLAAQRFLEESASQLTYHGLCELGVKMSEGELAVFFRNNHFSTIYKLKTELFLLVTDQGFLKESCVVWETLSNIDGDCHFVDDKFVTAPPKEESAVEAALSEEPLTPEQQMDRDHLMALSLAEDDKAFNERAAEWEKYKAHQLGGEGGAEGGPQTTMMSDEELAKRLQDEEDRQAAESADSTQQRQQRPQQQQQGGGGEHPTAPPRHQHHQQQDGPHPSSSRQAAGHPGVAPTRDRDRQRSGNKNCTIL